MVNAAVTPPPNSHEKWYDAKNFSSHRRNPPSHLEGHVPGVVVVLVEIHVPLKGQIGDHCRITPTVDAVRDLNTRMQKGCRGKRAGGGGGLKTESVCRLVLLVRSALGFLNLCLHL